MTNFKERMIEDLQLDSAIERASLLSLLRVAQATSCLGHPKHLLLLSPPRCQVWGRVRHKPGSRMP
jgi:hypothetical protein